MDKKNIGILGYGQIGQGIQLCHSLSKFKLYINDAKKNYHQGFRHCDILNICIPFENYDEFFNAIKPHLHELVADEPNKHVIIHGTVSPGTCDKINAYIDKNKLGIHLYYSPVIGKHPYLYNSLQTFKKHLGTYKDENDVIKLYFEDLGINIGLITTPKTLELSKILSTSYYGICIAYMKEVQALCAKHNVNFDEVYTKWNTNYNEGYTKIGDTKYIRPVLTPSLEKSIGGHCVVPNVNLVNFEETDSDWIKIGITKFV